MCTQSNQDIIDGVITEWIGQKRAFTAFEVSLEAKKKGADERHRDMKGYIHSGKVITDEMEFGDYTKTLVDVTSSDKAFLYHPQSYDPSTYQPLARPGQKPRVTPVVGPASQVTPAMVAATAPVSNDSRDEHYTLDYRNRLMIPTKFIRACGLNAGDNAYLFENTGGGLVLSKNNPGNAKCVRVEHNGDIRLSKTTLQSAGMNGSSFSIQNNGTSNGDIVEIEEVVVD